MSELILKNRLDIAAVILASGLAESTKKKYLSVVKEYLATGGSLADEQALATFAVGLSVSRRNNFKSALRRWAAAAAKALKAAATPGTTQEIQAALWRLESIVDSVEAQQPTGEKLHTWLNQKQVKDLLATCDPETNAGKRDRVILALLVGAGLRRQELAGLRFEDIALIPMKGKFRTVLNIRGKGKKARAIPISDRLAAALDSWAGVVGKAGHVARAVSQVDEIGETLSEVAIFHIVAKAGALIGLPELAPHDLRRTYAQLGYEAGVSIVQISKLLGHASVATTQRYLRLDLDLETTVSDFIPI